MIGTGHHYSLARTKISEDKSKCINIAYYILFRIYEFLQQNLLLFVKKIVLHVLNHIWNNDAAKLFIKPYCDYQRNF